MRIPYHTNMLSFGVPLEDIFPPEQIHPALENLFSESYNNIVSSSYGVEEILTQSRLQGKLHERLNLKDRIIICKTFGGLQILPGIPLWVVRHFLGLLPTPLLPEYGDGKEFTWLEISIDCKICFTDYVTRGRFNPNLLKKVAGELMSLPPSNLLLVTALFDFLRKLAVLPRGESKINKSALFAIVKYFTQSIFLRPFRPGWVTKIDKEHYSLQLYLILKWPEIRKLCIKPNKTSSQLPIDEVYPGYYAKLSPGYPLYLSKRFRHNQTQTDYPLQYQLEKDDDILIRVVPPSYDDFNFLKDTACQTENFYNQHGATPKNRLIEYVKIPVEPKNPINRESGETKYYKGFTTETNDALAAYDPSYESSLLTGTYDWKADLELKKCDSIKYGWKLDENDNISYTSPVSSYLPGTEFLKDVKYWYDGLSNEKEEEKHSLDQDLKEKITQMGWTYTPPSENKTATTFAKYDPGKNDYRLGYDLKRLLNKELKEKLDTLKISEIYENEIGNNYEGDAAQDLTASNSKLHLPEKSEESKKSLINVGKIKSKLDFLKIFSTKKGKAKKSSSCEEMPSEVKYEKMGSTNSLL